MRDSPPSEIKTLPLDVANPGFMLDRLGMDCAPLQFIRELTQNSIEAILRTPDKRGEITWDVDWITYDLAGLYKLSITDTGDGMTGEEMVKYINHLSASGNGQSHHGNFGVGAKIAAATRNHAGLIYLSWKHNVGSTVHLWREPTTNQYGLRVQERPDESSGYWANIESAVKPDGIDTSGTKVILYGNSEEQNTMTAPEGAPSPSRWVTRYLNTRYYRFPEGVAVRAREGWEYDRKDTNRNVLRSIIGQKKYNDQHSLHRGSITLNNATAHWWILRQGPQLTQNSGTLASNGHCAALHKDELYEMTSGRTNTAVLQNFGVIFGYQQVVIYVEPSREAGFDITTDTARSRLLINSQPLPWMDWAAEFREKMPGEILAHMQTVAAASEASDHKEAIKERLKQIEQLFKLTRYRPSVGGPHLISADALAPGGKPREGSTGGARRGSSSGSTGGRGGSVYSLFLEPGGVAGREVKPDPFPEVRWISIGDATRPSGDLEDRAAKYIPASNMLLINADFRLFTDMISRWAVHYSAAPEGTAKVVEEVVREWFEQALVEAVLSSNALRGSKEWTDEEIEKLLSEESLTGVVLPRWHIEQSIKRSLGSRLGSLRAKAS